MAVIPVKVSQDYKNLKDAFNAHITSNHSPWARTAGVIRDRQDTENAIPVQLKA
jgi:hypothetical protein